MGNTGHNSERLVILLLVVGLTAFSSAVKDLTQIQQWTLDASRLVAQWSGMMVPTELPSTVVKIETCENKALQQSTPSVELPWLGDIDREKTIDLENTQPPRTAPIAKIKKLRRVNVDQLEVRISTDEDAAQDEAISSEIPVALFKAKTRKQGAVRINTRDREMLLKTLNRSINFRFTS